MRSYLFVPGDSAKKLEKAFRSGADALIIDLEDSVAAEAKEAARRTALTFLRAHRTAIPRPLLYVRINGLTTDLADGDLDVVMTGAPDGIVLPKAAGGGDVTLLGARLAVREALHNLPDGGTRIVVLATESPAAIFTLGSYRGASPRLEGLAWGTEDLGAATGVEKTRVDGVSTEPFRIVRGLALFAAAAAGVQAIDAVYGDYKDLEGLARDCEAARRDGFTAKLAIHPDQVDIINAAFAPSAAALDEAERVVAAFAAAGRAGAIGFEGRMLDRPHLDAALRLLAAARRAPAVTAAMEDAAEEEDEPPQEPVEPATEEAADEAAWAVAETEPEVLPYTSPDAQEDALPDSGAGPGEPDFAEGDSEPTTDPNSR